MKTSKRKKEEAPGVESRNDPRLLDLYQACRKNAAELLEEAEILLKHSRFERAFFLALSACEELGKAQLVADYYSGCVAKSEFEAAFQDHKTKIAFHERYILVPQGDLVYDRGDAKELWIKRLKSLYVQVGKEFKAQVPVRLYGC